MKEENIKQQHLEKTSEKNSVIAWVKEHKSQLLLAGVSVTTVILTVMGIKNKETLTDLWKSLKKQIEKVLYIVLNGLKKQVLRSLKKQEK